MKVFISYQRGDTAYPAQLLRYALQPQHQVFINTGDIAVGGAFRDVIRGALASSELVLALIGGAFVSSRLHEPLNAVAYEWRQARFLGCRVHPVLVDGAQMLPERDLPADLRWLPGQNASRLTRQGLSAGVRRAAAGCACVVRSATGRTPRPVGGRCSREQRA